MKRILIVDDDLSVCSCLAECLRQEGYDVAEAFDSSVAIRIAEEQGMSIGAVVSDVEMPGMNGFEMWRHMRPLPPPGCKILFMSGVAQKYLGDGTQIPGELIQKPFPFSELLGRL